MCSWSLRALKTVSHNYQDPRPAISVFYPRQDIPTLQDKLILTKKILDNGSVGYYILCESERELHMPPLKKSFTTFDIRNLIGTQIDCLKDWMNRDYIQPSIQKASGRGTKNLFSLNDLYLIALFQYVVRNRRLSRDDAAIKIKIIRELHEIAINSDKITNKLAQLGVADIKHKFEKLEKIDYIFFYQVDDEDKAAAIYNIPPVDVFIADGQTDTDTSKLKDFLDRYEGCDDILAVNFKKIRQNIDVLLN